MRIKLCREKAEEIEGLRGGDIYCVTIKENGKNISARVGAGNVHCIIINRKIIEIGKRNE